MMTTKNVLGQLVCLKIGTEESFPSNNKLYLSKIIVIDCRTNNWFIFTHEDWLPHSGLINEELLLVEFETFEYDISTLLIRNIRRRFADDHLWLSIGTKRIRSIFTRLQRLLTCFVALFLSMIASCMFYRSSENKPNQNAFTIGPFSFTVNEVYVSFASSVIVIPALILITTLFNSKNNRRLWIISGWILAILAILASGFFTILYSIQWGKEKSLKWLASFFLSFFESFALLQPIKIVLIVIFLTFILEKESEIIQTDDRKEKIVKLEKDHLNLVPIELNVHKKYIEIKEQNKIRKEKKKIENRMRKMIFDIIIHIIFFSLLLFVCYTSRQQNTFYQNNAIIKSINNLNDIKSFKDLINWLNNTAIPKILPKYYYNNDNRNEYDLKFMNDLYQMKFSYPKLIKEEFIFENCDLFKLLNELNKGRYCIGDNDKKRINFTNYNKYINNNLIVSLTNDYDMAIEVINNLTKILWFNRLTRKITLEIIIMNNQWMSRARWIFERNIFGQISSIARVDTLKLYRYSGPGGLMTLIFEGLTAFFGLLQLLKTILICIKEKSVPSLFLILALINFVVAAALYIWRTIIGIKTVEMVMNSKDKITDFSTFFESDTYFMIFLGLSSFFAQIHLLEILKISKNISILATVLIKTKELLFNLLICYLCFLIGSSFFGLIVFGPKLDHYKTLISSSISLFRTIFGKLSFESIEMASGLYGKIFIIIYAFLIHYLATNFLITILNDILKRIKLKKNTIGFDEELYKYMGELFMKLFKKSKNSQEKYKIEDEIHEESINAETEEEDERQEKIEKVIERYDIRKSLNNRDFFGDLNLRLDDISEFLSNCQKVQAEAELKITLMKHSLKNCEDIENVRLIMK